MALFGPPGRGDRIARLIIVPLALIFVTIVVPVWILHMPVRVEGISMEPTLFNDDRLLVTRGYRDPVPGDVVRVLAPSRHEGMPPETQIKRVVAVAGQTVEVDRGEAIVDGVSEPDTYRILRAADDISTSRSVIPEGHIYLLGDNRPESFDSRFYGPLPLTAVFGRVTWVFMPVTRLGPVD